MRRIRVHWDGRRQTSGERSVPKFAAERHAPFDGAGRAGAVLVISGDETLRRESATLNGPSRPITTARPEEALARALGDPPEMIILDLSSAPKALLPLARALAVDERLRRARLVALADPSYAGRKKLEHYGYFVFARPHGASDTAGLRPRL